MEQVLEYQSWYREKYWELRLHEIRLSSRPVTLHCTMGVTQEDQGFGYRQRFPNRKT